MKVEKYRIPIGLAILFGPVGCYVGAGHLPGSNYDGLVEDIGTVSGRLYPARAR